MRIQDFEKEIAAAKKRARTAKLINSNFDGLRIKFQGDRLRAFEAKRPENYITMKNETPLRRGTFSIYHLETTFPEVKNLDHNAAVEQSAKGLAIFGMNWRCEDFRIETYSEDLKPDTEEASSLYEELRRKLNRQKKSLTWWTKKYFPDKGYAAVRNQLIGASRMSAEVRRVLSKYLCRTK